jgi:hypothetical protein
VLAKVRVRSGVSSTYYDTHGIFQGLTYDNQNYAEKESVQQQTSQREDLRIAANHRPR